MSSDAVISLESLGKCYQIYDKPRDRLLQMLFRSRKRFYREFWALRDVNLHVSPGEVIGVIGSNGAGKSTLLQLICGTLSPTCGEVQVKGRVAALLELGAGFNPEFTGRENIYLSAAVTGMPREEIRAKFDEIVEFSGISQFIDQPVKTYSSGMYVRLAFSVAINVDPDILIIDEALSVGDGEFARKSFDRIMTLKNAGKTILFCSHSMYQVEAICNRAIWLEKGIVRSIGSPSNVIVAYNNYLDSEKSEELLSQLDNSRNFETSNTASIKKIIISADGEEGPLLYVQSGVTTVTIEVLFRSDPNLPAPSVAVMFTDSVSRPIASAGTQNDGVVIHRDIKGDGQIRVKFPGISLLKGNYWVYVFLMCENGVYFYETASMVSQLCVSQRGLELGVVSLPHFWCD
ncbi:MAG: ABC transporter ATP-binding protein [Desulfobulbus sp.]